MNNCYVFTSGGFKPIDKVVNGKSKVFAVDNQLQCTQVIVEHWKRVNVTQNYCVTNVDHKFKMWFSDLHTMLVIDQRQVEQVTGKQYYHDYQTRNWKFPTLVQFSESNRDPVNVYQIQQMAKNQILSTELIGGSKTKLNQLLYEWQNAYGGYYARNHKQLMMLQSIVTSAGIMSYVVRNNGFKVIPYTLTTMSIDKISATSPKQFNVIPYDAQGNQLHLIYNVDNYTYVL